MAHATTNSRTLERRTAMANLNLALAAIQALKFLCASPPNGL
eukprot:CAMPEP_0172804610 /NCGR_PEP_ID=MMETSP1075-20121228/5292_1 /TAXON_ID=2916 /ORGANISM="Ceratium fusus, Strain PA161109" /LENGTH=41 /DNA_ID= /DNA_START= /DNA_END= /DNA_ORIENTATION=